MLQHTNTQQHTKYNKNTTNNNHDDDDDIYRLFFFFYYIIIDHDRSSSGVLLPVVYCFTSDPTNNALALANQGLRYQQGLRFN